MPVEQLAFIDRYRGDVGDRSKVVQKALRLLQQLSESGKADLESAKSIQKEKHKLANQDVVNGMNEVRKSRKKKK
jgi:hypothetical protein